MKWCDLTCEHASFPKVSAVDGAGSCRTFQALHCARLDRLVHKNAPCPCEEAPRSRNRPGRKGLK